jgi:4-amino-4-deoxy-L-arabinose transferase-like glycosyltransferase
MTSFAPPESTRRERLVLGLGIFGFALAVRGLQLWQLQGSVLADMILGDAVNYDARAREIAAGDWIGDEVFYQAPLYSYFLAVVYRFVGDAPQGVRVIQAFLGAASCAFVAQAGWRLFGRRAALLAGLVLSLYTPAVFFDSMLQKACIDGFLVSAMLWLVAELGERADGGAVFGLGLLLGALALSRENALVFGLVLGAWLVWLPAVGWPGRTLRIGLFAAGLAVVLVPVALRNWSVSGDFHLTTSQFGHNFFIGNNPAADGTYQPLLHARGDPRVEIQDAIDLAERQTGRSLTRAEVSDFYFERGLDFVRSHPGDWALLLVRKLRLSFNSVELVDTEDQYTHEESSSVLRWTGFAMHFGTLAPLALLGAWITWSARARLWPLYLLFAAYAGSMLLFYVFARYRMPVVPILALFAGAGLGGLGRFVSDRPPRELAAAGAAILAFAVFCNWPMVDVDRMRSVTHFNVGNELVARERTAEGIHHYREAIRLHADNALANHNLGAVLAAQGDLEAAKAHFERALEIAPSYLQARENLARVTEEIASGGGSGR